MRFGDTHAAMSDRRAIQDSAGTAAEPLAHVFVYDADGVRESRTSIEDLGRIIASGASVWADIEDADRGRVVALLARVLDIHPLSQDVLLARDHRPSVDEFPGFAHVIVDLVHLRQTMHFEKVDMLVGPTWLVTVQDHPGDCFDEARRRLRNEAGFRARPTAYLLHALMESVCGEYHRILAKFGQRLEQLELRLIARPTPGLIHRIHAAKRDLRGLRRAVVPLRESIETLFYTNRRWHGGAPSESPCGPDFHLALREVHDELGGVLDVLDAYRDATHNLGDLYVTSASNRVNDILRVLTIISTIFIPLSFVAGIYGMNFERMPELGWRFGYPMALLVMAAIASVLLLYFHRKGWLRGGERQRTPSITRTTSFFEDPAHRAQAAGDERRDPRPD
jgi:magnesium transporter